MNPRLLLRVTAPAVAVGLLLFAACLASMRYIDRLHANLTEVLSDSVGSMRAAQELEIRVRQLRYHSLMSMMDPDPTRRKPIQDDLKQVQRALEDARRASTDDEERECVSRIEAAFVRYQREQTQLRSEIGPNTAIADIPHISDSHPVRLVVEPCQELLRMNEEKMLQLSQEGQRVRHEAAIAMLILGMAGPVGGLIVGYGVARGFKQSIARLSVRLQDMAQHLERDVGSVNVVADGDFQSLDRQMEHVVTKLEDVAGQLQRQQRELLRTEQLAAVGQLAAGVAHEVRNPLTGIKMLVDAALRPRNAQPLQEEDLRVMHREIVRLEHTVQGFLDFARLPAPQRKQCDLREVVQQARDLVRGRADQQRVEVVCNLPDRPLLVSVDGGQLGTVLVNLLLNALDAMPGGGRVVVKLERLPNGTVCLAVDDTGPGIPAKIARQLFVPFTTTKPAGTGLGLSLSARIVEEHGGTLTGVNRPEGGARFVITLARSETGVYRDDVIDR